LGSTERNELLLALKLLARISLYFPYGFPIEPSVLPYILSMPFLNLRTSALFFASLSSCESSFLVGGNIASKLALFNDYYLSFIYRIELLKRSSAS